jgi:hypothetical protein
VDTGELHAASARFGGDEGQGARVGGQGEERASFPHGRFVGDLARDKQ